MTPRRKYSREFKVEAVRMITQQNLSVAEVARDLDVSGSRQCRFQRRPIWPTRLRLPLRSAGMVDRIERGLPLHHPDDNKTQKALSWRLDHNDFE